MNNLSSAAIWATIALIMGIIGLVIAVNNKKKDKNAQDIIETNTAKTDGSIENKQRHGCVTAWLILMIIFNSLAAVLYLFGGDMLAENMPGGISIPIKLLLAILGIGNVFFSVMLLKWKKWGFWGFIITSVGALIINLSIGLGISQSLFGLVGIAVLFGVLQINMNNVSAWNNLE